MIQQKHRFKHRFAVQAVYRKAKTVRGAGCNLKFTPNHSDNWRAAVVVSRKTHKSAVIRNRIRRRIYEWLRINQDSFSGNFDIIITVFDSRLASMPADELSHTLGSLLRQARIINIPA